MERATVPEETANSLLETLLKDRIQDALNSVFRDIKVMSVHSAPAKDQAVVRFALLNMVEKSFQEILEEQRRRVSSRS